MYGQMEHHPCCRFKGLSGQSTVMGLFWPDMNTESGVTIYMYLKHSPDDSDSICIYRVHRSISLGPGVISEVPFLAF